MQQVTIYSTTTCPYCKMLKEYLEEKSITYTEKLVDQDDEARKEMMGKSGGYLGVPFTVIEKDGIEASIVGFDKSMFNETLGISQ
jgi:glutaredoxin 3